MDIYIDGPNINQLKQFKKKKIFQDLLIIL